MSKQRRKPRSEVVQGTTAGEVSNIEVRVAVDGSHVEFVTPMTNLRTEYSYERPKGPKVLNRTPADSSRAPFDVDDALKDFDLLVAVDTNTREVCAQRTSVTGVVLAYPVGDSRDGQQRGYWRRCPFAVEFSPRCGNPENFGWLAALQQLDKTDVWRIGLRVALIVDSDLDALQSYNAREAPFFENDFLPDGIQMIYASADAGGEKFANQLIRGADRVASEVLSHLADGEISLAPREYADGPVASFRIVHIGTPD